MSLRTQVVVLLVAVTVVTSACSAIAAIVALNRHADALDRRHARAYANVSRAVARRTGKPLPADGKHTLPGVLRPGLATRGAGRSEVVAVFGGALAGGAFALVLGLMLVRRLRRPLDALRAGTDAVAAGRFDHRIPVEGPAEVRALAEGFNGMAGAIERSDGARRAWLDELAHELRTPVAVLQAYSEALADGLADERDERELAQRAVAANAAQCAALLNALREDSTGADPDSVTDLDALLAAALERFAASARDAGSALSAVNDAPGARVRGDAVSLGRVLNNLLENALKAAGPGGIVAVAATRSDDAIGLTIDDSGPGIRPEDRVRAFDRLWRGDEARTRGGGMGLGLAISRRLVEQCGGAIAIVDGPLGGARLVVTLVAAR